MHIPILSRKKDKRPQGLPSVPAIDTSIKYYTKPKPGVRNSPKNSPTRSPIAPRSPGAIRNGSGTGSRNGSKELVSSSSSYDTVSRPNSNANSNTNLGGNLMVETRNPSLSLSRSFEEPTSPSSIGKRQVSDRVKQTPSSLVRNSRIYSNDFDANMINSNSINSLSNLQSSRNVNSFSNSLLAKKSVPPELSPVVTLFNCHNFRQYKFGPLLVKDEDLWLDVDGKLTGNELSLWDTKDEFVPRYFNLFDYNIALEPREFVVKFSNDLNEFDYPLIFKCSSSEEYIDWVTALYLSNFERLCLNEAFSAVVLSLIGSKLSDIHTLLAKKKYAKYDWCNIRLPQVNHKWVKCYLAIYPSSPKKAGSIEIYQSDKVNKKNLICYIKNVTNVYNIFPENVNMIEFNSIMKLNGDIYINRNYEHMFWNDPAQDLSDAISINSNGKSHSRSKSRSISNTLSTHARNRSRSTSIPIPPPNHFGNGHKRTSSQSSFFSNSSSPPSSPSSSKNADTFIKTNYIYLMPASHPGVQEIETMIRNYIPIIDCFKLYGRPEQLISDKLNKQSLLFGLPSLPHYQFLSMEDTRHLVELYLNDSISQNWSFKDWALEFRTLIEYKINNSGYVGDGNIIQLYKSLELDESDLQSLKSFPEVSLPQAYGELSPSPNPAAGYAPGSPRMPASPRGPWSPRMPTSPQMNGEDDLDLGSSHLRTPNQHMFRSPSPNGYQYDDNFLNADSMDKATSPVAQLGELDEPIKLHPYRQKA